jgi:hypothetical protein
VILRPIDQIPRTYAPSLSHTFIRALEDTLLSGRRRGIRYDCAQSTLRLVLPPLPVQLPDPPITVRILSFAH